MTNEEKIKEFIEYIKNQEDSNFDKIENIYGYKWGRSFYLWTFEGSSSCLSNKNTYYYYNIRSPERGIAPSDKIEDWLSHEEFSQIVWSQSPKKTSLTKPPFVDKGLFSDLEYEVYTHTAYSDSARTRELAFDQFKKVISRRLREWPMCCGDCVEMRAIYKHDNAITTRLIPSFVCPRCFREVNNK